MSRILDDWLLAWAKYCKRRETDPLYKTWVGLSTVAAVLERKCWVEWNTILFPNLYVLLVGEPAARKGTAMEPGLALLSPMAERGDIFLAANAGSMQGLFEDMVNTAKAANHYPAELNTKEHSSISAFCGEFSMMMGTGNIDYCNALTDLYDCGHPRGVWKYKTRTSGVEYIKGPWLNLLGCIQPEMLPQVLPREVIGGGLTSRFLMVFGEKPESLVLDPVPTTEEKTLYAKLGKDLERIWKLEGPFEIATDWKPLYNAWREAGEKNPPLVDHQFEAYLGRRQTHLIKICMILSAARDSQMVIDADIFMKAQTILEATEQRMGRVFEGHGTVIWANMVPPLLRFLKRRGGKVPRSDISAHFYKDIRPFDLKDMLIQLQNKGDLHMAVGPDGRQWIYSPEVYLAKREAELKEQEEKERKGEMV